jgi:transglutaminase-like putative cysteine protease
MSSIQARIAALNLEQVNRTPSDPPPSYGQAVSEQQPATRTKRPPPPLPSRPPRSISQVPNGSGTNSGVVSPTSNGSLIPSGNLMSPRPSMSMRPPPSASIYSLDSTDDTPVLPPRRTSTTTNDEVAPQLPRRTSTATNDAVSPLLPPRRPSGPAVDRRPSYNWQRRGSTDSTASAISTTSGVSVGSRRRMLAPEYDPSTLPPLPTRKAKEPVDETPRLPMRPTASSPAVPRLPPPKSVPPLPTRPQLPTRPSAAPSVRSDGGSPPPVPLSSRPDIAAISASKPKSNAVAPVNCLICRDFSAQDAHAARFPRESIPSLDIRWLARELTAPFEGPTDKARVIFTWLHHNICYDTVALFSNNVKSSTPASTLASGLAVCEGYAGLFNALAAASGVESIVVTGHGKGSCHVTWKHFS